MGTVGVIIGVVLAIVGLFVLVCIPHNVRVRRVRRIYKSLPTDVPDQVLGLIEQVASNRPSVAYLKKSILQADDERAALDDFLKYGNDPRSWSEYIFLGYHHHQHEAIFLTKNRQKTNSGSSGHRPALAQQRSGAMIRVPVAAERSTRSVA